MTQERSSTPAISVPTRRTVIAGALAAPLVAAGAWLGGALRRSAAAVRPGAQGTSSTRCASCGETGHSMLACPSNPKVRL